MPSTSPARSASAGALPRTVEPELMDDAEQARAYADANFEVPHEHCADLFVARVCGGRGASLRGAVLDLGCGPADVLVRVARRCPEAAFDGVDGSAAMLSEGRARVAQAGLSSRVRLAQALLPRDKPPRDRYDVVFSNSLLHHLHDPQGLWTTAKAFGAPGAAVFVMDLMRPQAIEVLEDIVRVHSAGEPDVLVRDFRASLHAAFTLDEVRAQLAAAGLAHLQVEATSDRHLVVSGRLNA